MTIRTITPARPTAGLGLTRLGCLGCPCASTCRARNNLSGLGCSCASCPNRASCPRSTALGRVGDVSLSLLPGNVTDWKTWLIWILVGWLGYELLFSKDKRAKRKARRQDLRSARDRYNDQVRKIREQYA
jgi:hypothetical protein